MRRCAAGAVAIATLALVSFASASSLTVSSGRLATDEIGVCTAAASGDTYVQQSLLSAGSSFGAEETLSVRSETLANRRAFVRFDLSPCSIPPAATVMGAELRLVVTAAPVSSRTHVVHRVAETWDEATTWNTQPEIAATVSASAATGTTAGATVTWTSPTLLGDVQGWVDGTIANDGWRIADASENAVVAAEVGYGASGHATATSRPEIFVTYEP